MRHLGSVVRILLGAMDNRWQRGAAGRRVAAQLIGNEPAWQTSLFLQQCSKEPGRGAPIPSWLDQDIEHVAVLIHGSPQVLLPAIDRHEQLVEVPGVAQLATALPEASRVGTPECTTPLPNRLVGDRDAALGEQIFHIPEAQPKPVIQPDGVADDVGREAVSVVARLGTSVSQQTTLLPKKKIAGFTGIYRDTPGCRFARAQADPGPVFGPERRCRGFNNLRALAQTRGETGSLETAPSATQSCRCSHSGIVQGQAWGFPGISGDFSGRGRGAGGGETPPGRDGVR